MSLQSVDSHLSARDPQLVLNIVNHLKSQGMFDQFRRECLADVDTKPSFQNLRQRVEGYVSKFLSQQTWKPDLNKNQLRDSLRKQINDSGMLSIGVEHVVDQVVNPKISRTFLPQIESVVRQYLGLERPPEPSTPNTEKKEESKVLDVLDDNVTSSFTNLEKIPIKLEDLPKKTPVWSPCTSLEPSKPSKEESLKEESLQLVTEGNTVKSLKEEKLSEVSVSTNITTCSTKLSDQDSNIIKTEEPLSDGNLSDQKKCTESSTSFALEEDSLHGFGITRTCSTTFEAHVKGNSKSEQTICYNDNFDLHVMVQDDNSASCVDSNDGESKLVINEDSVMSEGKFDVELESPHVHEDSNLRQDIKRDNSNSASESANTASNKISETAVDFQNIKEEVSKLDSLVKDNMCSKHVETKNEGEPSGKISTDKIFSSKHSSNSKQDKSKKETPKKHDKDKSIIKTKLPKCSDLPKSSKCNTKPRSSSKDTEKTHKLDSSSKVSKVEAVSSKTHSEHKSKTDSTKSDQKHKSSHSSKSLIASKISSKSSSGYKGDKHDNEKKSKPPKFDISEQKHKSGISDSKIHKDNIKDLEKKIQKVTDDKIRTHSKHSDSKPTSSERQKSRDRSKTFDKSKNKNDSKQLLERYKSSEKSKHGESVVNSEVKRTKKVEGASSKEVLKSAGKKTGKSSKKLNEVIQQTSSSKTSSNDNSSSNSKGSTNDNSNSKTSMNDNSNSKTSMNDNSSSCESKSNGYLVKDLDSRNSTDKLGQSSEIEELSNTCFMPECTKEPPEKELEYKNVVKQSTELVKIENIIQLVKEEINDQKNYTVPLKKVDQDNDPPDSQLSSITIKENADSIENDIEISDKEARNVNKTDEGNCKVDDQLYDLVSKVESDVDKSESEKSFQILNTDCVKNVELSEEQNSVLVKEDVVLGKEDISANSCDKTDECEETGMKVQSTTERTENIIEVKASENRKQVEFKPQSSKHIKIIDLDPEEETPDLMESQILQKTETNLGLGEERIHKTESKKDLTNEEVEDDNQSDSTVSSVHTSDLSSFDDKISLSSSDELEAVEAVKPTVKEKKIPLKEMKEVAETYLKEKTNSSGRSTPIFPSGDDDTNQSVLKRLKKSGLETEDTQNKQDAESQPSDDDDVTRGSSRFGRPRKANPKYPSEEYVFNSSWKESESPPAVVLPSRRTTRRSAEENTRTVSRCSSTTSDTTEQLQSSTPFSKVGARQNRVSKTSDKSLKEEPNDSYTGSSKSVDKDKSANTKELLTEPHATDYEGTTRPKKRSATSSSVSPEGSKTRTENQRYSSSDLYKPRPVIGSRRHRTSEDPSNSEQDSQQQEEQTKRPRGRPRKRPPTPEPPSVAKRKR